ncbi:MAG: spore coat U domain-containing protein [Geminicoccaceae bacterium]|jgi:spore coat protein U-like protein
MAVALGLLLVQLAPAEAGTLTSTLAVTVVVQPACTVSGATLDFGSYTSGQPTDLNGFAQIAYSNCPAGQLRFQLDGGGSGSPTARRLSNGSGGLLAYGIYRDSARTQVFGQGANSRLVTLAAAGSGNVSVYGKIPAGQSVAAGTYSDTVVITLDF